MLRFGKITEIDVTKCYARVTFSDDGIVSDFLQIVVMGALSTKFFHIFDINEQIAVLMDEHSEEGVILGAVFNDNTNPPEGANPDIVKVLFPDGSTISYDRQAHEYKIDIKGVINIISTDEVNIQANSANVTADTVEVDATTVTVDADSVTIDAIMVDITGTVNITGELVVSGSITAAAFGGAAGAPISGTSIEVSGQVKGATVKAGTVDLGTHIHAGVSPGSGSTSPPTP